MKNWLLLSILVIGLSGNSSAMSQHSLLSEEEQKVVKGVIYKVLADVIDECFIKTIVADFQDAGDEIWDWFMEKIEDLLNEGEVDRDVLLNEDDKKQILELEKQISRIKSKDTK